MKMIAFSYTIKGFKQPAVPILLALCFNLLFSACRKTEPVVMRHTIVPEYLKNWALFNKGSYWIIADTSNTKTDSAYVTDVISETIEYKKGNEIIYAEQITVQFSSNYFYPLYRLTSYPETSVLTAYPLLYITANNEQPNGVPQSSLTISNQVFTNVLLSSYQLTKSFPSGPSNVQFGAKLYWKKNAGILKVKSTDDWPNDINKKAGVIRYHTVQ